MGFMDKLKEKAENVRDKAVDFAEEKQLANKLGSAKDSIVKAIDDTKTSIKTTGRRSLHKI